MPNDKYLAKASKFWYIDILLLLISITATILFVEYALRLFLPQNLMMANDERHSEYDPVLGWRLKPNVTSLIRGEYATMNSDGMRVSMEMVQVRDPTCRIAFIGDSFIFGVAAKDADIVTTKLAGFSGCEVLNFGVPGYGTDQYYLLLKSKVLSFQPDVILVGAYANDFKEAGSKESYGAPKPVFVLGDGGFLQLTNVPVPQKDDVTVHSLFLAFNTWLNRNSHAYIFLKSFIQCLFKHISPDIRFLAKDYDSEYKSFETLNEAIYCKMSALAKRHAIPMVVVQIPSEMNVNFEVYKTSLAERGINVVQYDPEKPSKVYRAFSKKCGFRLIDLYTSFNNHPKKENLYERRTFHWSAYGHDFVAKIIMKYLQDMHLLPK